MLQSIRVEIDHIGYALGTWQVKVQSRRVEIRKWTRHGEALTLK